MAKLDLQNGGIKSKLILHVEKLVFGLAVLLVAAFIYLGTQQESIDTTPEAVKRAAEMARQNIEKQTWSEVEEDRWQPPEYQTAATRASKPIPLSPYETPQSFRVRHRESIEKRPDPELLTLTDIEVTPGFAPFAILSAARGSAGGDYMMEGGGVMGGGAMPSYGTYDEYGLGEMGQADVDAPPMLTAEQQAKFASAGGGGGTGNQIKGTHFVAITALAPLKKQLDLYDAAFKDRAGYLESRDYPSYVHFIVERREQAADGSWSEWEKKINTNTARFIANQTWAIKPEEVAPPEYIDPILTFPLPPILLFNPGDWGLHSSVPKFEPIDQYGGEMTPGMMEEGGIDGNSMPLTPDMELPGDFPAVMGGQQGGYPGMEGGMEYGYGSGMGQGMARGMNGRTTTPPKGMIQRRGGAAGGSNYGGGDYGGGMYESGGYSGGTSAYDAENKMFRFYDTTVQPNKSYQYRVQLWLEDPNNPRNLQSAPPTRALEAAVVQRVDKNRPAATRANDPRRQQQTTNAPPQHTFWRTTEFSEPSEPVRVPTSADVLTGSVDAGRTVMSRNDRRQVLRNSDPTTTVLAMKWDDTADVKAMVTKELPGISRGGTVEFQGELWVLDPGTLQFKKVGEEKDYSLKTGYTVLDIRGGEDLPGRLTNDKNEKLKAPGEILVLDNAGNIRIKSELEEIDEFSLFNFTKPEVKKSRTPDDEMDYMESGYDEYGGSGRRNRRSRGGP